jgi:hypothetical protein
MILDRAALDHLGLTVPQLVALCGVHRSVVYRYLSGDAEPPGALLALLEVWPAIPKRMQARLLAGEHLAERRER